MSKKFLSWMVVLSIAIVAVMAVRLYATQCTTWYNLCQETCEGQPNIVIYGDQSQAVECWDSNLPCVPNYWIEPCSAGAK